MAGAVAVMAAAVIAVLQRVLFVSQSRLPSALPPPIPTPPQAAVTLLEERGRLPAPGVHTPASLLRGTTYVDRLRAHGITFEQVDSAAVPQ